LVWFVLPGCALLGLPDTGWHRTETVHFEIVSVVEEPVARQLAVDLEVFRRAVEHAAGRPLTAAAEKIRVVAFDARLRERFDSSALSGYLFTTILGPSVVLRTGRGLRGDATLELRRDLAMQLLADAGAERPLWFDVGLAEVLSTLRFEEGRVILGAVREDHLLELENRPWVPTSEFLARQDLAELGRIARAGYRAQAWLLMHRAWFGTAAGTEARRLVDALDRNLPAERAVAEAASRKHPLAWCTPRGRCPGPRPRSRSVCLRRIATVPTNRTSTSPSRSISSRTPPPRSRASRW
jgi:hypothetical protein